MATGKICKIKGCNRILKWNDGTVCGMHRSRFSRHGNYNISPNWTIFKKGQPSLTKLGYLRIFINGKRVLQHRYIMEQYLSRKLRPKERIHHINGIKTDNRIENLKLFKNNKEHMENKHHIMWNKRKDRYSTEILNQIFISLAKASNPEENCFCGDKFEARNLCPKHYQWVYKHKFI